VTRKRNDKHSTEFGLWLREQDELDSKRGFVATNLDYIWTNYKTGEWMLIEEKRCMSDVTFSQAEQYKVIHRACLSDANYRGCHLIQFERASPDDGEIYLNKRKITREQLLAFLAFDQEAVTN